MTPLFSRLNRRDGKHLIPVTTRKPSKNQKIPKGLI